MHLALSFACSLFCFAVQPHGALGQAKPDPNTLVLSDDLSGPDFTRSGGLYYKKNFEQSAGRVTFGSSETRDGRRVLELAIEPVCPADGKECSERAEIWERNDLLADYDKGVWYAFSLKFGDPLPTDSRRYLMAQWKRQIPDGIEGDFSPFLALRLRHGHLYVTVETELLPLLKTADGSVKTACAGNELRVSNRGADKQTRAIVALEPGVQWPDEGGIIGCSDQIAVISRSPLPSARSGWIDFAFYSRPGPAGDGHIEIIANGKWVATVKGRIGHAIDSPKQYFKFGPYREAMAGRWTLYYERFRRSPNCQDAAPAETCAAVSGP